MSFPLKPALEAILSKDRVGIRILLTISVVTSALVSVAFTNGAWIILVAIVLIIGIWFSAID